MFGFLHAEAIVEESESFIDREALWERKVSNVLWFGQGASLTGFGIAKVSKHKANEDKTEVETVRPAGSERFESVIRSANLPYDAKGEILTR